MACSRQSCMQGERLGLVAGEDDVGVLLLGQVRHEPAQQVLHPDEPVAEAPGGLALVGLGLRVGAQVLLGALAQRLVEVTESASARLSSEALSRARICSWRSRASRKVGALLTTAASCWRASWSLPWSTRSMPLE